MSIALLGRFTNIGRVSYSPPEDRDRLDLALVAKTPTLSKLYEEAQRVAGQPLESLPPAQRMEILFDLVCCRFIRDRVARHTLWSNWLIWTADRVLGASHPSFGIMYDPDNLLRYGHSALCGQISFVLVRLAMMANVRARHVGVHNHVVMEAWYDDDWHMFDPYAEVMGGTDVSRVDSVRELAQNRELVARLYEGALAPEILGQLFSSRQVNTFATEPPGTYYHWKGQVMFFLARPIRWMKYIIPIIMTMIGLLLQRRQLARIFFRGRSGRMRAGAAH